MHDSVIVQVPQALEDLSRVETNHLLLECAAEFLHDVGNAAAAHVLEEEAAIGGAHAFDDVWGVEISEDFGLVLEGRDPGLRSCRLNDEE